MLSSSTRTRSRSDPGPGSTPSSTRSASSTTPSRRCGRSAGRPSEPTRRSGAAGELRAVQVLEPDRPAMELEHGIVADRARPQAAGERQVEAVAYLAPLPFVGPVVVVEDPASLLRPAAAAIAVGARADEQVALHL